MLREGVSWIWTLGDPSLDSNRKSPFPEEVVRQKSRPAAGFNLYHDRRDLIGVALKY
jgi:hypothetical protein